MICVTGNGNQKNEGFALKDCKTFASFQAGFCDAQADKSVGVQGKVKQRQASVQILHATFGSSGGCQYGLAHQFLARVTPAFAAASWKSILSGSLLQLRQSSRNCTSFCDNSAMVMFVEYFVRFEFRSVLLFFL